MRKLLTLALLGPVAAMAQVSAPMVSPPANMAVSDALASIAMQAQTSAYAVEAFRPRRDHSRNKAAVAGAAIAIPAAVSISAGAPYVQTATVQPLSAPLGVNFEALGVGTPGFTISGAPPDTTLAVSPTQVVQWVNSQFAVYNKSGTPLLPSPGFVNGNLLWQAMPASSLCRQFNRGDPIVRYDAMAKRWIFSQFAFNDSFSQNAQCFAVSTTDNALGSYTLYEYNFGDALPDYGKMGVWHDAYFMSYNMFGGSASFFSDARACAYDRAAMLNGLPATQICFANPDNFSYLPADMDGTRLPPAGTPNVHVSWNWYNVGPPYTMQLTKFKPDFAVPANSTFNDGFGGTAFSSVEVLVPGTLAPCNDAGSGRCVQQLGAAAGDNLDTLGDRHMYRLAYRNFGSYDSLLITQSVDPDAAGARRAAVRWIEVRNPGANPPVVFQNSTYNVDATSRWMSSGTFDKLGNIGIGYSASSSAINPGIRISGRLKNDPKNLLRAETVVQAGTGSQVSTFNRWGDYSTMQIDPADDCTFWYTTQYIGATGSFNWRTRVASFKFPSCQ